MNKPTWTAPVKLSALAIAFAVSLSTSMAAPQPVADAVPGAELHKVPAKKGWFWYKDPVEPKKVEPTPHQPEVVQPVAKDPIAQPLIVIQRKPKEPDPVENFKALTDDEKQKLCTAKDTWQYECGFIDPGNDFEFQAKQRDILLQVMSLTPDNPESVEAAQRYMKWVVGKASMAANMWYFNMVQNPDLDPTVKNPISEVGLALASRVQNASQYEYFKLIREEGGKLFFFTRNDCSYCHDQAPYAQRVAASMGIEMINIPLDGTCLPNFEGEACGDNIKPEQTAILDVKIVPALYLYVPSNTWIRLGTGVMADSTILANTVNFFSAYRAAMIQGLDNGNGVRPSVSFAQDAQGHAKGTAPANGESKPTDIDRGRMMHLLGYE